MMKFGLQFLTLPLTALLVQCASMDSSFQGYSDLPVSLGSQDGIRISATAPPQGETRGRLRLVKESVIESTHGDLYTGKSLTIASLMANVSGAFDKAAHASPGTNVYTLGSLSAGGEARFNATGDGGVQIEYLGNSTGTVPFSSRDVATLKQLFDQALTQQSGTHNNNNSNNSNSRRAAALKL